MPAHNSGVMDDPALWARQEAFGGGVNGFVRSSRIGEDQMAAASDVLVDQSLRAQKRPGADALASGLPQARAQGLAYFDVPGTERLVACADDALYAYDGANWSAALSGYAPAAGSDPDMAQGINELLIADGVQNVFAWDGAAFADLGVAGGASIVAWHTYRAFYAGFAAAPDELRVSDVAAPGTVQDPAFVTRVGEGEGEAITALAGAQGYWLVCFKESSIWMLDCDPSAEFASEWRFSKITGGVGCVGKRAAVRYGNDVFFLARDGVRTLRRMGAAAGQYETSPPLSQPVQDVIDRINWDAAHLASAGTYDQFVLFGLPLDEAAEPGHTLVWNGRLGAWMGLWSWDAAQFEVSRFGGAPRLCFGRSGSGGGVSGWKFDADRRLDATYREDGAEFPAKLLTRAWDFGDAIARKETWRAELRFVDSSALVTVRVVLDNEAELSLDALSAVSQNALPVGLPFDLATDKPVRWRRGMGKRKFNELQLEIEAPAGRMALESVSLAAFMDPYR